MLSLRTSPLRGQRGQTSAEYIGIVLVVVAIIATIATSGIAGTISGAIESAICSVGASSCSDGGRTSTSREGGRSRGGRDGVDPGPGRGSPADRGSDGRSGANGERPTRSGGAAPGPEGGGPGSNTPANGLEVGPDGGAVPTPFDPPAPDKGSGPHATQSPGIKDRLNEQKWRAKAEGAELLGFTDAARHMRHYLDNSGTPLNVDVGSILHDEAPLRDKAGNQVNRATDEAVAGYDGTGPADIPFRTSWEVVTAGGENWNKALGSFLSSVTGTVHIEPGKPPKTTVVYRVHVHDRYNWDDGKFTPFGGGTTLDSEMQNLHRKGLAREYDVNGTSEEITVSPDPKNPGSAAPPSGDGRKGGRGDPGRSRG